jgi:hypothetical protein
VGRRTRPADDRLGVDHDDHDDHVERTIQQQGHTNPYDLS